MSKNLKSISVTVPSSLKSGSRLILPFDEKFIPLEIRGRLRALEQFSSAIDGTVGARYRFRAECVRDADLFLRAISSFIEPSWAVVPFGFFPDVEVSFTITKPVSARDLLWIASCIEDGHVLVQTLEKEACYTGARDYYREIDIDNPATMPATAVLNEMRKGASQYVKTLKYFLADATKFAADLKL